MKNAAVRVMLDDNGDFSICESVANNNYLVVYFGDVSTCVDNNARDFAKGCMSEGASVLAINMKSSLRNKSVYQEGKRNYNYFLLDTLDSASLKDSSDVLIAKNLLLVGDYCIASIHANSERDVIDSLNFLANN